MAVCRVPIISPSGHANDVKRTSLPYDETCPTCERIRGVTPSMRPGLGLGGFGGRRGVVYHPPRCGWDGVGEGGAATCECISVTPSMKRATLRMTVRRKSSGSSM